MRKLFFILVVIAWITPTAYAANWYVRKGATGSNNGTNWTNAWNEMSAINFTTVACGDTIWIAGGTYTSELDPNKNCTSSTVLTINRVLSTDAVPVASPGWNSSFDSQVIISNNDIDVPSGAWITIDGRIGSTAGNNFGISVRCTSSSGCGGIGGAESGNISHISFHYIELYGPPCVETESCSGGASGLNVAPGSNTVDTLLFDHGSIHRYGEDIRTSDWTNGTIQYSDIYDTHNDGVQHEDIIFSYPITNFTFRYNRVWMSPNDGLFFFGNETNTQMYGNVIYHSGGALITYYEDFTHNVFVYNNVFENDGSFGDFQPGWLDFSGTVTGAMKNNVFENITPNAACAVCDYNAYSTSVGKGDNGAHSFTYNAGTLGHSVMFVNESPTDPGAADFHPTTLGGSTFAPGLTLAAPYNVDPDGNTRGAGGNWTIGAYQFISGTGFNITGTISGSGGPGATVNLTGTATGTVTANGSGGYSFTSLANGSYTVTPSKTGFTFTPTSQGVTLSGGDGTANFSSTGQTAAPRSVTGKVSFGGNVKVQ